MRLALLVSPAGTDKLVDDFNTCIDALDSLGRTDEIDAFREKALAAHAADWRFMQAVAESYRDQQHVGVIIAGVFHRGLNRNGDGRWVSALERDRLQALQMMLKAMPVLQAQKNPPVATAADFYIQFAGTLLIGNNGADAWRLQDLTDISALPDYVDVPGPYFYYGRGYGYGSESRGAPVDENGNAVLHHLPKGDWSGAKTDGERWRWLLLQASELSPDEALHAKLIWAGFLQSQFGTQSVPQNGTLIGRTTDDLDKQNQSGPNALSSLKDDETVAKLATGIKRFHLDDEFNPIAQFKTVSASQNNVGKHAEQATDALAALYENREQYNTSADYWKQAITRFGDPDKNRQPRLDQIVKNWGRFETFLVQPAGDAGAKFDYRYRNGNKVTFTATEIDVTKVLTDLKAYINSKPAQIDWRTTDFGSIGWRLVQQNETKYLLAQTAKWSLDVKPRPDHFDDQITVQTPLKKAGAYLLAADMGDGNTSRIIAWVTDTVIVQKPMSNKVLTYIADAVTGKPIPGASVDYFGWKQQWLQDNKYLISTQSYSATANADGEIFTQTDPNVAYNQPDPPVDPANPKLDRNLQWLTTATTKDGRLAFIGWGRNVWAAGDPYDPYDSTYNRVKAFIMTDRAGVPPGPGCAFQDVGGKQ